MANLIMNNINLGPIINAYGALPTSSINEGAVYRLYIRKFDIDDGHGKDSTVCPVGYYKPAEGSKWWHNEVERGSYGQVFDGYSDCPVQRMREGRPNALWDPVPCAPNEASGIFYYDIAADKCFFAHHDVGYGGVNLYTAEMLDKDLSSELGGYYVHCDGNWMRIDVHPDVMIGANGSANGKEGIVPAPSAGKVPHALNSDARWVPFKAYSGSRDAFLDATGRTLSNVNDEVTGLSVVYDADLTIYNHCTAVISWTIKRASATEITFYEIAHEYSSAVLSRSATISCSDGVLTAAIISEGISACSSENWVCTNEHYDSEYITTPDSYLVFGKYSADRKIALESTTERQKIEYDHAARFNINGAEVYGNLNSVGTVVFGRFTVVQEMIGTINGKTRASHDGTGHYMRIGRANITGYKTLEEIMGEVVWENWTDVKNPDLCTVYLTQEEYDLLAPPDPNIIYTIID